MDINKEEVWKAIKGYEGKYEVSNLGRIRSIGYYADHFNRFGTLCRRYYSPKIRSVSFKDNGYLHIGLNKDSGSMYVHRIVAEAFIPNDNNLVSVNHKNGNKEDNCVENLEWASYSENQFHQRRKLDKDYETDILDKNTGIYYLSMAECFEAIGVTLGMNYRSFRCSLNPKYKGYNQPTPKRLRDRFIKLYNYNRSHGNKKQQAIR